MIDPEARGIPPESREWSGTVASGFALMDGCLSPINPWLQVVLVPLLLSIMEKPDLGVIVSMGAEH